MRRIIIIPAYNEQDNILGVVKNIQKSISNWDYIVINDCSTDNTKIVCIENNINTITLPINLGIGGAMQTGYQYAYENGYDIAVQIDGDGQHDPIYLDQFLHFIENEEVDLVIGSRFITKVGFQSSHMRRLGIKYFQFLLKVLTGLKITDATSGYRVCNKKIIEYFAHYYPKDYPEPESIMTVHREGFKIKEIPVVMMDRQAGTSSIKSLITVYYMIKVTLAILIDKIKTQKRIMK